MKSFFKLWPFLKPQWKLIAGSLLFSIPLSVIRFSPAPMIKYLTDSVLIKKDPKMLMILPLIIIGAYFLNLLVRFTHAYLGRLANERVMRDIRERLLRHYLGLSSAFFTESSVGSLISRVTNDVSYVSQGTINLTNMSKEFLTFSALFIYALKLNPKLLLISLMVAPLLLWFGKRSGILIKGYSLKMQEANSWVYSSLQETFSGFKVIKAFALEAFSFNRFKSSNNEYVKFALKTAQLEELGGPLVELMGALAIAIVFYIGGHDVIVGKLQPGDLLGFFTAFGLMIIPVRTLNDINNKLNQAGASAERIQETLNIKNEVVELSAAQTLPTFQSEIEFVEVGFRYHSSLPWVFRHVNFKILKGKLVAIVGASGQGKSTAINLLPRLYDVTEGSILIDGHDIKNASLASLRRQMALVTQDVFLFNDTVYANIALGNNLATREEVYAAAKTAQALSFIEKLPQGFDTMIGDRGQKLSGGERQRLSIARALLRNAPILLLDEATSSLDSESEKLVQQALEVLMEGRTTLVVAHRLSTIKHAHQILVLSNGKICEMGTHHELMDQKGEYARFYSLLA